MLLPYLLNLAMYGGGPAAGGTTTLLIRGFQSGLLVTRGLGLSSQAGTGKHWIFSSPIFGYSTIIHRS